MDVSPVLRSGLCHANDSLLRPEANLLLKEVLELFKTEALVTASVDSSDASLKFTDLEV